MGVCADEILAEYGEDVVAPGGARRYLAATGPRARISSPAQYVAICRQIARPGEPVVSGHEHDGYVDWRLVAVGHGRVPPAAWMRGELARLLAYWRRCADRPDIVGSNYNPTPEQAYAAMVSGWPAWAVRVLARHRRLPAPERLARMDALGRRRYVDAARALSRESYGLVEHWLGGWTIRALAALGRLCPELQRAAMLELWRRPWPDDRPIRVRDIPWEVVARAQRQILADPSGRVRAAWAEGERRYSLALAAGVCADDPAQLVEWLLRRPMWAGKFGSRETDKYLIDLACRIVRGESPVEIARRRGGDLTRAEAHEWITTAPMTLPCRWLVRDLPDDVDLRVQDCAVARWLLDVHRRGAWSQLTRERTLRHNGETYRYRYISRLDEIRREHLPHGPRTSVDQAFQLAAADTRNYRVLKDDHVQISTAPEDWPAMPEGMRLLATAADLVREGEEMHHCVGGYVPMVRRGETWIASIRVGKHRSTVQLDRDARVLQHYGPCNSAPHEDCVAVLEKWMSNFGKENGNDGTGSDRTGD